MGTIKTRKRRQRERGGGVGVNEREEEEVWREGKGVEEMWRGREGERKEELEEISREEVQDQS